MAVKQPKPTKTFGIRDVSDLFDKLCFDVSRLKAAKASQELRYAAFDCAVVSLHLADWLLHSVAEARCIELCGKKADERGALKGFIERNAARLPHLAACQQIANSSKHLKMTITKDDPAVQARSTIKFEPPFRASEPDKWKDTKAFAAAFVTTASGGEQNATVFFDQVVSDWRTVLDEDGLINEQPPEPNNVFS